MSELAIKASEALSPWPLVQAFFIAMAIVVSIMAMRRGERDRKDGGSMEIPLYLAAGPVYDALGAVHDIAEESRKTNALLQDISNNIDEINRGQIVTRKLLEDMRNGGEMLRPARR